MSRLSEWYAGIRAKYVPRPRRPYEYLVNRYYAHLVDPVLTLVADRLGFSPNAVTVLSLLSGLAASWYILEGYLVAAAVLIQLHHLLDGVDGNLARTYRLCSDFGKRLDQVSDQVVNLALFVSLAVVADVPMWLSIGMLVTLYIDIAVIRWVVTPFSNRHRLLRHRWKQWFMDRGLMPAFDIFLMYAIVSICLIAGSPEAAVILVTALKSIDWSYRLLECYRTWTSLQKTTTQS